MKFFILIFIFFTLAISCTDNSMNLFEMQSNTVSLIDAYHNQQIFKSNTNVIIDYTIFSNTGNISKKKIVTANSYYRENFPSFSIDGDYTTFWKGEDRNGWLIIDLGKRYQYKKILLPGARARATGSVRQPAGTHPEIRRYGLPSFFLKTSLGD